MTCLGYRIILYFNYTLSTLSNCFFIILGEFFMLELLDKISSLSDFDSKVYKKCIQLGNVFTISDLYGFFADKLAVDEAIAKMSDIGILHSVDGVNYSIDSYEVIACKVQDACSSLISLLPFFCGKTSKSSDAFKVNKFYGKEGIKKIHEDILATLSPLPEGRKEFYQISSSKDLFEVVPEHQYHFIDKRIEAEIQLYWMAPKKDCYWPHTSKPDHNLRFARMFDVEEFPFHIELDVYANKVAIITLHEGRVNGLIIEDNLVAESMRSVCDFLWKNLAKMDDDK